MVPGKCSAIKVVVGMVLTQQNIMRSSSDWWLLSKCHHTIHIGFLQGKSYNAAAVAAGVLTPSVAGAAQVPKPASVLAGLREVINQHITNVKSAEMSSFLGELRNVLGNYNSGAFIDRLEFICPYSCVSSHLVFLIWMLV